MRPVEDASELPPGALVCLRDADGHVVGAKQVGRDWELAACLRAHPADSLTAEALYTVLRRGSHIAFQCLG